MLNIHTPSSGIAQVAYHQAGHTIYYILRGIIPCRVEVVNEDEGYTSADDSLEPWSALTQDFVLLAGTVAQHIYAGDFAEILEMVQTGGIPEGALSDFFKLSEQDPGIIAQMMLYLYDLFVTERWLLLSTIAEQLIQKRVLQKDDIAKIVVRLNKINQNLDRIAKIRQKRIYPAPLRQRRRIRCRHQ